VKFTKKKELFEIFIRQIPTTSELFPVLRLIFPESDPSRGAYGLKEHSLGRMFSDLLILPNQEKERLLRWKDPNLQAKHNCTVGDFPSVLLSVIEPRISTPSFPRLTIGEVNKFLTDVYTSTDPEIRKDLFRDIIYRAKPLEIKWIIKILLRDMKLGIGVESILRHLHPNAIELYHISNSIQHVLTTISDKQSKPLEAAESSSTSIYFQPIKPMLSERVNPGDVPERFAHVKDEIFLEPKIDGERMLVHVNKQTNNVAIYSRNGVNFTKRYGDNQLSPILMIGFKGLGAVFDGEMVAWDSAKGRIHAFGSNRDVSSAAASDANEGDTQDIGDYDSLGITSLGNLFYIAFDLIYYVDIDGREHDLRNTSLADRRILLERIILPVPHRFEVIHSTRLMASIDGIKDYIKSALDRREEGVVIKRSNSVYKLGVRGAGWYKVKADYDYLYSDTLDLVVLGGYFSESVTGAETNPLDAVTSFLVGVPFSCDNRTVFKTVTKVGAGLTRVQLVYIRNQLKDALLAFNSSTPLPEWFGDWKPSKPNRPDVVFSPWLQESSVVLEVRAGEINMTSDFSSGFQLRFPRVVKPRTDKDWTCATSFDELRQIATTDTDKNRTFIQDLSRFERGGSVATTPRKEPRKRKAGTVIVGAESIATQNTQPSSCIFAGVEIYVVNGCGIAETVLRLGGSLNPVFRKGVTQYCIAERDDLRVKNIVDFEACDVVNSLWIHDCEENNRILEISADRHLLRGFSKSSPD
jgi:DNA ligase-4